MNKPTRPRIFEAQNTPEARRLVAAQARLYSDAKIIFAVRVLAVFALALTSAIVALIFPSLRAVVGAGGGALVLVLSIVIGSMEKWVRTRAVATQEQFDTQIFQLPWNHLHIDRPSPHLVARAAQRYKGQRDKDWYDDTEQTYRPFDVLICQSSNLGWGARMHLLWGWFLVFVATSMGAALLVVWAIFNLSGADVLSALIVPSLAPFKEIIEQIKANFETARTKESVGQRLSDIWEKGMSGKQLLAEEDLRAIQDKILLLRLSNPYVPDWFDNAFHGSNEATMRTTTADSVSRAKRYGLGG